MTGEQPVAVFDVTSLLHAPQAIEAFIKKFTAGRYASRRDNGPERRSTRHYPLSMIVEVQPLDENLNLQANPFRLVTRDLSLDGIGMQGTIPVNTKFLALQLTSPTGEHMQVMLEVLRCHSSGNVYDIAGRFVIRQPQSRYVRCDVCGEHRPHFIITASEQDNQDARTFKRLTCIKCGTHQREYADDENGAQHAIDEKG